MLLESVAYTRPTSVDEALAELAANEGAAVLAGGQSLLNVLKNRVASVESLVDIGRLDELRRIDVGADGSLEIGACVTYDELDRSPDVRAGDAKAIVRAAAYVRANGTIEDARVALAVVGPRPIRHAGMEERLRGSPVSPEAIAAAAEAIGEDLEPVSDAHASAGYRREMARVVARRAVADAIERGAA